MATRQMNLYGEKIDGVKISDYGLEHGYLDYQTLAQIVGLTVSELMRIRIEKGGNLWRNVIDVLIRQE